MITVRQMERFLNARDYARILHDLTSQRADALIRWEAQASRHTLAAAMCVIRLDELNCAAHPLASKLIAAVLASQEADGGWGDALSTALCLRALLAGRGDGVAVDRGLAFLANLQQDEGAFPAGPFRRMPADSHASAAVLYLLAELPAAWGSIDLSATLSWLQCNAYALDTATRALLRHAALRCQVGQAVAGPGARSQPTIAKSRVA